MRAPRTAARRYDARMRLLAAFFSMAALLAPLSGQRTHIVQGGGDAYRNAVNAANHGDTLIVRAAVYLAATSTNGITVLCDPGVLFHTFVGRRWARSASQRASASSCAAATCSS